MNILLSMDNPWKAAWLVAAVVFIAILIILGLYKYFSVKSKERRVGKKRRRK